MSDQIFWFATRSAGIVCWFAAAVSIMVGLLIPTRVLGRRPTVPWLTDLHRFFGAMSVLFLVVHMGTLWADEFIDFGFAELLLPYVATVPGLSRWSLALGVVAAWFLFAIEGTSLIKDWMSPRAWHTVHLTSFGVLISGALHAVSVGSDTDNRYLVAATTSVTMAILILGAMRAFRSLSERKRRYDQERDDYYYGDEYAGLDDAAHHDEADHGDPTIHEVFVDADAYHYGRAQLTADDIPVTSGARLLDAERPDPHWPDDGETEEPAWLRPPPRR